MLADTSIRIVVYLLSLTVAGCAERYSGRVIDAHRRAVVYAHVEGHGMHGAFPLGEAPFVRSTVANADGKFTLVSWDWPTKLSRRLQTRSAAAGCRSRYRTRPT